MTDDIVVRPGSTDDARLRMGWYMLSPATLDLAWLNMPLAYTVAVAGDDLVGFSVAKQTVGTTADLVAHQGLAELNALARETWLLRSLSVDPRWEERGAGKRLIDDAGRSALQAGASAVSIIFSDDPPITDGFDKQLMPLSYLNKVGYFEGFGFTVRAERHGGFTSGLRWNWLLMMKELNHG